MRELVYNPTSTVALKFINLEPNLIISYMKLVIEFVGVDWLEHLWVEHNSQTVLTPGLADLEKFMFSDRYHLTASTNSSLSLSCYGYLFQSLQDVSFVAAVECLPKGESRVL